MGTTKLDVKSRGGQAFTVYGKSGKWGVGKDLYSDLVAPDVGNLLMEGWRRGVGVWGPSCDGKAQVLDVLGVKFPEREWSTTQDHSKWAVSQSGGNAFCVGDINRAQGQDKRGGATICIRKTSFADKMRSVVADQDSC